MPKRRTHPIGSKGISTYSKKNKHADRLPHDRFNLSLEQKAKKKAKQATELLQVVA